MKADERHLKQFKLIQNERKKINNAKPKLYEGDRVVAREPVYTQKPLNTDAIAHRRNYTQTLLHTNAFTQSRSDTQAPLLTDTCPISSKTQAPNANGCALGKDRRRT